MRQSSKLIFEKEEGRSGRDHDDRVPHEHEVFVMEAGARSPSAHSATISDPVVIAQASLINQKDGEGERQLKTLE